MHKNEVIRILKCGGIGVFPTDTLYGLLGSALNRKTVGRIYKVRKRNSAKPFIILISAVSDLRQFHIRPGVRVLAFLERVWPGPVSVILNCPEKRFRYLHRGTDTLAFRIPRSKTLRAFLEKTGPLVAPTANFEGETPAGTISGARRYFGGTVDFYFGSSKKHGVPSTLIRILR